MYSPPLAHIPSSSLHLLKDSIIIIVIICIVIIIYMYNELCDVYVEWLLSLSLTDCVTAPSPSFSIMGIIVIIMIILVSLLRITYVFQYF